MMNNRRAAVAAMQARETNPSLVITSVVVPQEQTSEGLLIKSHASLWVELVTLLGKDWSLAYELSPRRWEEIIAGAFDRMKFDEVILTPSSGDFGRDVIATKRGIGAIKILGSVKALKAGNLVRYDDVRALIGVVTSDQSASKGMITTTSDFPPRIGQDKSIAPFLPTRIELVNGLQLQAWLMELCANEGQE